MISLSSSLFSHGPSLGTSSVARLCDRDLLDLWFTHRLARNLCPFQRPSMNLSFWHLPAWLPGSLSALPWDSPCALTWPNVSVGFILSDVVADLLELGLRLRDTISRLHPSQSAQPWLARELWCFVHGQICLFALVLDQAIIRRAKLLV